MLDVRCECWMFGVRLPRWQASCLSVFRVGCWMLDVCIPAPKVAGILPVCFQSWMLNVGCSSWMFHPWERRRPAGSFSPCSSNSQMPRFTITLGRVAQKGMPERCCDG